MKKAHTVIRDIFLTSTPVEFHASKKHIKAELGEDLTFVTLSYRGYLKTDTSPKTFLAFLTYIVIHDDDGTKHVMTINPNNWVNVYCADLSLKDQRFLKTYFLENGMFGETTTDDRFSSLQFFGKSIKQATKLVG